MKTKTTKNTAPKGNSLLSAMKTKDTVTHNGAVSHSTTGTKVLDLFGKGGAMRSQSEADVINLFSGAYTEDKTLALKVLFYLADVRQGQGERKLFRTCYNWLAENDSKVATKLLEYIPEYTRFDNVLETLENTKLEEKALDFIAKQLKADLKAEAPTLCAKWAPSEQASSQVTKRLARKLRTHMELSPKAYRKMLSKLRKEIDIVERKMCDDKWSKINYEAVPSRASTIYRDAFKKHDPEGYTKFIGQVEKGEKKINASVLYPYDIVRNFTGYTASADATLEAQWKALPDYLKDNPHNGLVVADVSGSMDSSGYYGGKTTNVKPLDVAVSLAIYFAERNKGAFHNNFMVFSSQAVLKELKGRTLQAKVKDVLGDRPVANTNLQSVFNLILDKATEFKVPESDMPSVIYLISDMQFDSACEGKTNLEAIKDKYEKAGYKMPRIVFWNVNSYEDVPVKVNDKGVCLVSGCSPSILKTVFNNKIVTPWDVMVQTVTTERYEPIKA